MKVDNKTLTELIERCFDLSMDGRLTPDQRKEFLALGKRLRGCLLNLVTAQFAANTKEVEEANRAIKLINKGLAADKENLEKTGAITGQLAQLVGILDDLLKIATVFA
jgi:hypothetical protein